MSVQKTGSRGTRACPCLLAEDDADPDEDPEDVDDDDGSTEFLTLRLNTGRLRLGCCSFLLDKDVTDGASLMKAS